MAITAIVLVPISVLLDTSNLALTIVLPVATPIVLKSCVRS